MHVPSEFQRLTEAEWNEFQSRADQFAEAIERGQEVDWNQRLRGLAGSLRQAMLYEFIKIDLDHAWKHGRHLLLDDYVKQFPELANDLPAHLVCEEYRIRQSHGDRPDPATYRLRFPNLAATLESFFSSSVQPTHRDDPSGPKTAPSPVAPGSPTPGVDTVLPAAGEYQLVALLGRGQFGEVWKAIAPGGVNVAVKVINQPADREAARRELQSLELVKNLRHPCLMSTLAYWTHEGKVYIVIELGDGTLRDRLQQARRDGKQGLPAKELVDYFQSAASGIDFLHARKVFHRDIKPDNILLVNGHAKLADFGLARARERLDTTVSFAGTPVYMAPEVWRGRFREQSDQYSLAVTYAELRLGRRPLEGKDFAQLMSRQLGKAPIWRGCRRPKKPCSFRALAKQPDQRFRSCRDFAEALRLASDGHAPPLPSLFTARSKRLVAGIVVAAAAVAGTVAILHNIGNQPSQEEAKESLSAPAGYRPVDSASIQSIGDRRYPTRIEREPIGGVNPTFVLIVPPSGKPFYVMETKAWNGLMAQADPNGKWSSLPPDGVAVGMTVVEANQCAKSLGGRLPTPAEWDQAVGFDGLVKNLTVAGNPTIGRSSPRPVNYSDRDVAATGVTDFAGNGREWTSETIVLPDGHRELLSDNPAARRPGRTPRPEFHSRPRTDRGRFALRTDRTANAIRRQGQSLHELSHRDSTRVNIAILQKRFTYGRYQAR